MDANDYQQMLMQGSRQRAGDATVPDKYVRIGRWYISQTLTLVSAVKLYTSLR